MRVSQPVYSCYSLLAVINPQHKASIELEDMKSILQRVPIALRDRIRSLFQRFIFETRSFEMTNEEFVAEFHRKTAGEAVAKAPSVSPMRKARQHQPRTSCCNDSAQSRSSIVTRECTPSHSPAPYCETYDRSGSQSPLDTSYTEIHEKRKEVRKQLERRDLVTAVRVDSRLRRPERTPSIVGKSAPQQTGYKGKGVRTTIAKEREVVEIRRRHLTVIGYL